MFHVLQTLDRFQNFGYKRVEDLHTRDNIYYTSHYEKRRKGELQPWNTQVVSFFKIEGNIKVRRKRRDQ